MELKPWDILASKDAFKNRWWHIVQETVRLPDGSAYSEYYVNHVKGAVVVFALTEGGNVLVNRQYKHGAREIVRELTVGRYEEDDSDGQTGARRELLEETGYGGGTWETLPTLISNPSSSTGRLYAYLARGVRKVAAPEQNPREIIEVEELTPAEFLRLCFDGGLSTHASLAVAFLAAEHLGWIAVSV